MRKFYVLLCLALLSTPSAAEAHWRQTFFRTARNGLIVGYILLPLASAQTSNSAASTSSSPEPVASTSAGVWAAVTSVSTAILCNLPKIWDGVLYVGTSTAKCFRRLCCAKKQEDPMKLIFSPTLSVEILQFVHGLAMVCKQYAKRIEPDYSNNQVTFELETAIVGFKGLISGDEDPPVEGDTPEVLRRKGIIPFTDLEAYWGDPQKDESFRAAQLVRLKRLAAQRLNPLDKELTEEQEALGRIFKAQIKGWYRGRQLIVTEKDIDPAHNRPAGHVTQIDVLKFLGWGGMRAVRLTVIDYKHRGPAPVHQPTRGLDDDESGAGALTPRRTATRNNDEEE